MVRLEGSLGVTEEEVKLVVTTLYFIIIRAAYFNTKPSKLSSFLTPHVTSALIHSRSELQPGMSNLVWESSIAICSNSSSSKATRLKDPQGQGHPTVKV